MESWGLLEQTEEDALHKSRLLSVEEKPFKRVTKRLLASNSIIGVPPLLPTQPIPNGSAVNGVAGGQENGFPSRPEERAQFREDVALDFAAFDSSIARIQFLLTSNERERERYAAEKLKILEASQAVRESTAQLHHQLDEARKTLEVRKGWDELSERITSNRMLRPREDQEANLERLQAEIAELERESHEYAQTWAERREQFGRIIKEGMELRRLIRDEKEEVERREGMADEEDGEEGEVGTPVVRAVSMAGTPRPPEGGTTPLDPGLGGFTRGASTAPSPSAGQLRVPSDLSPPGGQTPRSERPQPPEDDGVEEGEDTTMGEQGEIVEDGEEPDHHLRVAVEDTSRSGSARMSVTSGNSPEREEGITSHPRHINMDTRDSNVDGGDGDQMDVS